MSTPLSTSLSTLSLLSIVKNSLPKNKQTDDNAIKDWIKRAMSRLNDLYIINNKGVYNVIDDFDFYNSNSTLINIRDNIRWCYIKPEGFTAKKLNSCMLKDITPNDVVLPSGIAYVQDIDISILSSLLINTTQPADNKGYIGIVDNNALYSSLALDNTNNTWANVMIITCIIDYYRPVILPSTWLVSEYADILESDIDLLCYYVNQISVFPNRAPFQLLNKIQSKEDEIVWLLQG